MPGADGRQLAARGQALAPVLGECPEHAEPHTAAGLGGSDQRLADQACQQVRHVSPRYTPAPAYLLGCLQRARPGKGGHPLEHPPLVVEEQVVAPVDHGMQGLVAGQRGPGTAGEQPELVSQPGQDVAGGQRAHPSGG